MPSQSGWLIEGQILRTQFWDYISIKDLNDSVGEMVMNLKCADRTRDTHLLIDARHITGYDRSIVHIKHVSAWAVRVFAVANLLSVPLLLPRHVPMLPVALNVLGRFLKPHLYLFETWEETRQFLIEQDGSLEAGLPDDPDLA